MGDYLSRTFLRANVLLFGGYRLGFARNEVTGVRFIFSYFALLWVNEVIGLLPS